MKRLVIILGLLLISSWMLKADDNWIKTNGPFGGGDKKFFVTKTGKIFLYVPSDNIYSSTDNGTKWIINNYPKDFPGGSPYAAKFIIDKSERLFFTNGISIYLYNELKENWKFLNLNLDSSTIASYKYIAILNDTIFFTAFDKGIYKLSHDLTSWSLVYSYNNAKFKNFNSISSTKNKIFFAVNYDFSFFSTDYGKNWDTLKKETYQRFFNTTDGDLYWQSRNLYRFNENTNEWDTALTSNKEPLRGCFVYPGNENILYFRSLWWPTTYRSKDKGISWDLIFDNRYCIFEYDRLLYSFEISSNKDNIYFGDNKCFYSSTDDGKNWTRLDLPDTKHEIFSIFPIDSNRILVINRLGLFQSNNKGKDYHLLFPQCSTYYGFNKIIKRGKNIYGSMYSNFFYSLDDGLTWTFKDYNTGIDDFDVDSNGILYTRCLRSSDLGMTWDTITGNLPKYQNSGQPWVTSFCMKNKQEIIVAVDEKGIYKTYDEGITWELKYSTQMNITKFLKHEDNIYIINPYENTILTSTDFGESWNIRNSELPTKSTYSISPFGELLSYFNGFFKSTDGGLTWITIETDFDSDIIPAVAISNDGTYWCGTDSGSVYYTKTPIVSVEPEREVINGISISPNPASDFIEVFVGANGRSPLQSEIKILNVYGQTVLSVGVQNLEPLRIDVSGLAPGIYFVRFGDRVSKFILL